MSPQDAMEIRAQQLRDEGFDEGFRKGFDEGFRKGFDEGFRKGFDEGLPKGLAVVARRRLLLFYEGRFGPVPPAVRARIEATSDPDTIMRWTDRVAHDTREDVDRDLGAS